MAGRSRRSPRIWPGRGIRTGLLAVAASACGQRAETPGGEGTFSVRDSAGVTIVESHGGAWSPEEAWSVAPEPSVVIGAIDGPEGQQLFEVGDVVGLPDGRIVAEIEGTELRFFSPDGAYQMTIGNEGEGPGEFARLSGLDVRGDTLLAMDGGNRRLDFFDVEGNFLGDASLERTQTEMDVHSYRLGGFLGDDVLLATWGFDAGMRDPPEAYWDSLPNFRYRLDGSRVGEVGSYGGLEIYAEPHRSTYLPFGRATVSDIGPAGFHIGDGTGFEYRVFGLDGELVRIVRGPAGRQEVTRDLIERVVLAPLRQRMEEADVEPADAAEAMGFYEGMPYPEVVPDFNELVVDATGHVWLRSYTYRRARGPTDWHVFDPEGRYLGSVTIPRTLSVREIGADYLLGTWADDLGIEFVLKYDISKP